MTKKDVAPSAAKGRALTAKQQRFCDEYLIDLNATQAAIRAGYSEKTAQEQASRLLLNVMVQNYIAERQKGINEELAIDAKYVMKRLIEIDGMDVLDILNDAGDLLPIREWPKVWRTTISGIDIMAMASGGDDAALLKKIKWPDKVKNIELLGKHVDVAAFMERKNLTVEGNPLVALMQEIAQES